VERAASLLGLPLSSHLAAHRRWVDARDRRTAGGIVAQVLSQHRWPAASLRPWLVAGARSAVCGRAWLTDSTGVTQPVFRA
jgi:NADPH-dependent ferric siderophore reductase